MLEIFMITNCVYQSATEENDSGGHVDGTCPTKVAQPNFTADWLRILVTSPD